MLISTQVALRLTGEEELLHHEQGWALITTMSLRKAWN